MTCCNSACPIGFVILERFWLSQLEGRKKIDKCEP